MTNHLDKNARVVGMPMAKLQAVLSSWNKGKSVQELARLSKVDARPGVTASLLAEAWIQKLVSTVDDRWLEDQNGRVGLTRAGVAVIAAEKRGRTSKAKADAVVQELLGRADKLSKDDKAPVKVDKIWIFGSFLDEDKDDIGDIDIVVETYDTGVVARSEMHDYIEENYPGVITESFRYWRDYAEDVFLNKAVFGPRRHRLLGPNDLNTLKGLHAPCAIFFDRTCGGIVEPDILPHHPDSEGRADWIRDRLILPDMSKRPDDFTPTPPFVVSRDFRRYAQADILDRPEAVREGDKDSFWLTDIYGNRALILRQFLFAEREWRCSLSIVTWEALGEAECRRAYDDQLDLASQIVTLAHADLLRLADHRDHHASMHDISIKIVTTNAPRSLIEAIDTTINRAFTREDMRQAMPDHFAFGLSLLRGASGAHYASPSEYNDQDWLAMQENLPFTKLEYERWAGPKSVPVPDYDTSAAPYSRF